MGIELLTLERNHEQNMHNQTHKEAYEKRGLFGKRIKSGTLFLRVEDDILLI